MIITNQKLADLYKIDTNIFNTDELVRCKVNILIEIAQEKLILNTKKLCRIQS